MGIILIDGLCCKEELIMDKMGDLTNVTFIGGSAGDDLKFENTSAYAILRALELGQKGQSDDYGELFEGVPTVGLSTYGEQYIGHINQTATMLVFR